MRSFLLEIVEHLCYTILALFHLQPGTLTTKNSICSQNASLHYQKTVQTVQTMQIVFSFDLK